jgi:hypothetical protein
MTRLAVPFLEWRMDQRIEKTFFRCPMGIMTTLA